ncbi:glycosyltransferase [Gluconacetobacter sp.]|uniref:glycosyltransferase n=1 Tax=Gluconacetobacter sp. TaxID=1935994 RepID=UPI0039EC90BC
MTDGSIDSATDGVPPCPEDIERTGDTLFATGRGEDAVRLFLDVTTRHPDDWRLAVTAATIILRHSSAYDLVEAFLRPVLHRWPDTVPAWSLLLHVRVVRGDLAGSHALFAELLDRYPDESGTLCEAMSTALLQAGHPAESLRILLRCFENSIVTPTLLKNMGIALFCLDRSAEAVSWYEKAEALAPTDYGITFGHACALIKAGRLDEGWPRYFNRHLTPDDRDAWYLSLPRLCPGDAVAGRGVVLFQEQGLGDTIQFIRFVPDLLAKGAHVTIVVPRPLVRLLAQSYPAAKVYETGTLARQNGYDYAAAIPDLPHIAGATSLWDVPAPIPYLHPDPDDIARFATLLPERRPRIGLVWAGEWRPQSIHALVDQRRSTTQATMAKALTPVAATLVSLQLGAPRQEIADWTGQTLCDPMGSVHDMADTAAIMASLDLVISVDTAPLHLAGALGCPVWMISRQDACWRWGDAIGRSPWYPTMRIFRSREATLAPILKEAGMALRTWARNWRPARKT